MAAKIQISEIKFKDDEHARFFVDKTALTNSMSDPYRAAFFYVMGILPDTRWHIESLYDFNGDCIKIDGLSQPWQTSGTLKVCRLALNLYNGFHCVGTDWNALEADKDGVFTPYELFATPDAVYMVEGIKIRYLNYFSEVTNDE